jgi:hypothetical protein
MRWNPFRITETWMKLIYVLIWVVAWVAFLVALQPGGVLAALMQLLVQSIAVFVAVRAFRGDGEPVIPERARWRATSRPTAGYMIAGILALDALQRLALAGAHVIAAVGIGDGAIRLPAIAVTLVAFGWNIAVGIFYLRSSQRLRRAPPLKGWVSRDRSPNF